MLGLCAKERIMLECVKTIHGKTEPSCPRGSHHGRCWACVCMCMHVRVCFCMFISACMSLCVPISEQGAATYKR
jgi:hypothetical protein